VALLFRGPGPDGHTTRATNLPQLIDEATGGRRGLSGGRVGWHGALSIPAVWSAVRLRANIVSSLPVGVFRRDPATGRTVRVPGAETGALQQPSAEFDIMSWLHASQLALDLRGNNYGRIMARDPRTYLPTQIELVHPDEVGVRTLKDGTLEYRFAGRKVDSFDVWHERQNEVPGSVVGMSPISAAARALGITVAAEDYGAEFFVDALHPSALMSSDAPIDEDQARIVKRRVFSSQQGREPLVLGGNWKYQTLSISPTDALLLEVLRYGSEQVAQLFDVPGELIGAPAQGSSVTYANREQRTQDLLALRLGPAIARRERALSRLTVRGQWVKLNTAALLRADLAGRYASYQVGLRNGFLSFEDVADLEDRAPLTAEQLQALHDAGILGAATPDDVKQPAAAGAGSTTTPQGVPA
jgi:HK97 family phage portal protein